MTDVVLSFQPLFNIGITIVVASIILIGLVVTEWKRKQRFLFFRITAQIIVVISLLGLLLQPSITTRKQTNGILLLTKNYSVATADSLLTLDRSLDVMRTKDTKSFANSVVVSDNELKELGSQIKYIVGEGFPESTLEVINDKHYTYLSAPLPTGISEIDYPKVYTVNRWDKISGEYNNDSTRKLLKLIGPAGVEDSIFIKSSGSISFSLSFYPKTTGKAIYQLVEIDSFSRNQKVHDLYVEVGVPKKLKIIFLSGFPTFEQRYLKNFLIDNGHTVTVRNQISQGRFLFEFGNQPSKEFSSINSTLLDEADLVLLDVASYVSLSNKEKKALLGAVENGMGMLIFPEATKKIVYDLQDVLSLKFLSNAQDTANFILERKGIFRLPIKPLAVQSRHTKILVTQQNNVASGFVFRSFGKIGFQFMQETYQLVLQGNKDAYALLWTSLLERVAREEKQDHAIKIKTPFPWYADEPLRMEIVSTNKKPSLIFNSLPVSLREDISIDNVWQSKIWLNEGWNTLEIDSLKLNLPSSKPSEWNSLKIANQIRATKMESKTDASDFKNERLETKNLTPLLFAIFLLASAFLWLVPKL